MGLGKLRRWRALCASVQQRPQGGGGAGAPAGPRALATARALVASKRRCALVTACHSREVMGVSGQAGAGRWSRTAAARLVGVHRRGGAWARKVYVASGAPSTGRCNKPRRHSLSPNPAREVTLRVTGQGRGLLPVSRESCWINPAKPWIHIVKVFGDNCHSGVGKCRLIGSPVSLGPQRTGGRLLLEKAQSTKSSSHVMP